MIPPEPEPTVPEYTYVTSQSISLGSVTGTLYTDIQENGVVCELKTTDTNNRERLYTGIILYEVDGTNYCYFVRYTASVYYGILGNNAEIGLSVPVYYISNGNVSQYGTEHVDESIPSDYFENIRTRNFTLTQRS